eukprot:6972635-Lingulodinium_polyedra.AAC.1
MDVSSLIGDIGTPQAEAPAEAGAALAAEPAGGAAQTAGTSTETSGAVGQSAFAAKEGSEAR